MASDPVGRSMLWRPAPSPDLDRETAST